MDSKKVFGTVRNAALASLVLGGLVVSAGCKSGGESNCSAKSTEKSGEQNCSAKEKPAGEHQCAPK